MSLIVRKLPGLAGEKYYSNSTVVGNIIFASKIDARGDDGKIKETTFEAQMIKVMDKVKAIMEQAGSSLNNVVKDIIIFRDLNDYNLMRKVQMEYLVRHALPLAHDPPCSSIFQSAQLSHPDSQIEMEVIGVVDRKLPGEEVTIFPAIYGGVKFAYPDVPIGHPAFSKSAVIGNLIVCSGMAGLTLDKWDITSNKLEDQMQISLDKIKANMVQAGTNMNNIIKVINLLKRVEEYGRMVKKDFAYFRENSPELVNNPPVHTFIQCNLHKPGHLIETEVYAVADPKKPGWEIKRYPLVHADSTEPFAGAVAAGHLVFTSSLDPRSIKTGKIESGKLEDQVKMVLDKAKTVLEQAGTSMNNILKTSILLKNMGDYEKVRKLEFDFYVKYAPQLVGAPPASTVMQPYSLTQTNSLIEVEVTAVKM